MGGGRREEAAVWENVAAAQSSEGAAGPVGLWRPRRVRL